MSDMSFIIAHVIQYGRKIGLVDEVDSGSAETRNLNFSANDDDNVNLITQHVPFETDLEARKRSRDESSVAIQPGSKRAKVNEPVRTGSNNTPGLGLPNFHNLYDKRVLKIFRSIRRNNQVLWPTYWSDDTFTYETKEYLINNWFDVWVKTFVEKKARNEIRIEQKKDTNSWLKLGTGLDNDNDNDVDDNEQSLNDQLQPIVGGNDNVRTVVKIDKVIGRGKYAKYPVVWSDGSASLETKEFLQNNHKDFYTRLIRDLRNIRQKKWLDKKRIVTNKFSKRDDDQVDDNQDNEDNEAMDKEDEDIEDEAN